MAMSPMFRKCSLSVAARSQADAKRFRVRWHEQVAHIAHIAHTKQVAAIAAVLHPEPMEKKDVRVQLLFTQSEIDALDAFRAKHQVWSRSEAIRRLVADGLKRHGEAGTVPKVGR